MGDSIEYCEQCENRVGCHLARQCFHANNKAVGPLDAAACSVGWTRQPPVELGYFWWWDGNEKHHPIVLDVSMEIRGVYYADGNHPFDGMQDVCFLGGWWLYQPTPETPHNDEMTSTHH
jgi:hypothetical protein